MRKSISSARLQIIYMSFDARNVVEISYQLSFKLYVIYSISRTRAWIMQSSHLIKHPRIVICNYRVNY